MVLGINLNYYSDWAFMVFQIITIVLAFMILQERYKHSYHSDRLVMIGTIIQEASFLWLSLCTFILTLILPDLVLSTFVYLIVSAMIFDLLMVLIFLYKNSSFSFTDYAKLRSETELEQFFLKFQDYLKQSDL